MISEAYQFKIDKFIGELKYGNVVDIAALGPKDPAIFIQAVKNYMDKQEWCEIEFNQDFSRIRKINLKFLQE